MSSAILFTNSKKGGFPKRTTGAQYKWVRDNQLTTRYLAQQFLHQYSNRGKGFVRPLNIILLSSVNQITNGRESKVYNHARRNSAIWKHCFLIEVRLEQHKFSWEERNSTILHSIKNSKQSWLGTWYTIVYAVYTQLFHHHLLVLQATGVKTNS